MICKTENIKRKRYYYGILTFSYNDQPEGFPMPLSCGNNIYNSSGVQHNFFFLKSTTAIFGGRLVQS